MKDPKTADRLRIQSVAIKAIHDFMAEQEVIQLMPVMLSTVTDPLAHPIGDSSIVHEGQKLELTKSMLLHKQAAFLVEKLESLYIMSPCIRLEESSCGKSGRHLLEFSQLDIEFRGSDRKRFRKFMEELVVSVLERVKKECAEELKTFGREFVIPKTPFKVYESKELEKIHGEDYEKIVSEKSCEPFWIVDLKREFYDREDPEQAGYFLDYDLVWPEGFGEALSGAERDWEYDILLRKLAERGQTEEQFAPYMQLAKEGLLVATTGGGLGIERLIRYVCGDAHISETALFPRTPGEKVLM